MIGAPITPPPSTSTYRTQEMLRVLFGHGQDQLTVLTWPGSA
nr:hypothetical protein [Pseudonocardia cypriaca]